MKQMIAALLALVVLAGCKSTPSYPDPATDEAQIVVLLKGQKRKGVTGPKRDVSGYSSVGRSIERGRQYKRVNYRQMDDIIVYLTGNNLPSQGIAPAEVTLTAGHDGFDHDQILAGPNGATRITLTNDRSDTVTLFCMGEQGDGFDVTLKSGESRTVTVKRPGTYPVECDEDESLQATLIVAPTDWATTGRAGSSVLFPGLPAGSFTAVVRAPRLPMWKTTSSVTLGTRATLEAVLTVNDLDSIR
jgi:plastocyanin